MQTTVATVIWKKYKTQGVAKDIYDALETTYGQARRSFDLPPIGQFGENSIHQLNGPVVTDTTAIIGSHRMATANCPKTWPPSCFARVSQTHTNPLPGNTSIILQLLPIINYWTS